MPSRKTILIASGIVIAVVAVALGLGLGLGLSGGEDGGTTGETIKVSDPDTGFKSDIVVQHYLDVLQTIRPLNEKPDAEFINATREFMTELMKNETFVKEVQDTFQTFLREELANDTATAVDRKLLSFMPATSTGGGLSASARAAARLISWSGKKVYDAIKGKINSVATAVSDKVKAKFKAAVDAKIQDFENAMAGKRKVLCEQHVGKEYYGNMGVYCTDWDVSDCVNGKATLISGGKCGAKFDKILPDFQEQCDDMTGTVSSPEAHYTKVCIHQVQDDMLIWDDGPSCPWYIAYLGKEIVLSAAFARQFSPNDPKTKFTYWELLGAIPDFERLFVQFGTMDAETYVKQREYMVGLMNAIGVSSDPNAYADFNTIFWSAGSEHDNCYHHNPLTYGYTKKRCDEAMWNHCKALCDSTFSNNNRLAEAVETNLGPMLSLLGFATPAQAASYLPKRNTLNLCYTAAYIYGDVVAHHEDSNVAFAATNTFALYRKPRLKPPFHSSNADACKTLLPFCLECETKGEFERGEFDLICIKCENGHDLIKEDSPPELKAKGPVGTCSGDVVACDTVQDAGGYGGARRTVKVDEGQYVELEYDAYSIPDQFIVRDVTSGTVLHDTGNVGDPNSCEEMPNVAGPGYGTVTIEKPKTSTLLEIQVITPCKDTQWQFSMSCNAPPPSTEEEESEEEEEEDTYGEVDDYYGGQDYLGGEEEPIVPDLTGNGTNTSGGTTSPPTNPPTTPPGYGLDQPGDNATGTAGETQGQTTPSGGSTDGSGGSDGTTTPTDQGTADSGGANNETPTTPDDGGIGYGGGESTETQTWDNLMSNIFMAVYAPECQAESGAVEAALINCATDFRLDGPCPQECYNAVSGLSPPCAGRAQDAVTGGGIWDLQVIDGQDNPCKDIFNSNSILSDTQIGS